MICIIVYKNKPNIIDEKAEYSTCVVLDVTSSDRK